MSGRPMARWWLPALLALWTVLCCSGLDAADDGAKVAIPLIAEGRPESSDRAVTGFLFRPEEVGPFPAVIIMHGCDGLEWRVRGQPGFLLLQAYARRYVGHGYVALILDSFEPRGVDNACGQPLGVSPARRAWDAASAARFLGGLGYVDKERVVLQGDSHGAWTTLVALDTGRTTLPERFAAGIAWYPSCYAARGFSAPVLILIGEADDWTPADPCQDLCGGDPRL